MVNKRKIDQTISELMLSQQRCYEQLKRKELAQNLLNFKDILSASDKFYALSKGNIHELRKS
jgi:hypothetical protein